MDISYSDITKARVDSMASKFFAGKPKILANIQEVVPETPELARVIVSFTSLSSRPENFAAVQRALGETASPIEGTFIELDGTRALTPQLLGWVRRNQQIKEVSSAEMSSLKVMASNLLMDPSDESLWELRASGNSKYLVRRDNEDLSELVETAKLNRTNTPVLARIQPSAVDRFDMVSFVDDSRLSVRYGAVASVMGDNVKVMPLDTKVPEVISASTVILGLNFREQANNLDVKVPTEDATQDAMIRYYQKVFGYSPEFMDQIADIIKDRTTF